VRAEALIQVYALMDEVGRMLRSLIRSLQGRIGNAE
jgi:hypothetical protein